VSLKLLRKAHKEVATKHTTTTARKTINLLSGNNSIKILLSIMLMLWNYRYCRFEMTSIIIILSLSPSATANSVLLAGLMDCRRTFNIEKLHLSVR